MKTYYSTFITGFSELIKQSLIHEIKDVQIDLLHDGLVIYKTNTPLEVIKKIRFVNNTFILLKRYPKLGNRPIEEMMKDALKGSDFIADINTSLSKGMAKFRIMATNKNQFVSMDKDLRDKLEKKMQQIKGLILDRTNPDVEFTFAVRRDGYGLFGLRITRHTSYEKILEKGEIYPELAHILCLISEPRVTDIFLDPFCGSGAIPVARTKGFLYKTVYASDIENKSIEITKLKANKAKKKIVVTKSNALRLDSFADSSIDKIVTDPPWGLYSGKELNLEIFYEDMLKEFQRIIKPNGIIVILVAKKDIFETVLSNF